MPHTSLHRSHAHSVAAGRLELSPATPENTKESEGAKHQEDEAFLSGRLFPTVLVRAELKSNELSIGITRIMQFSLKSASDVRSCQRDESRHVHPGGLR